MSSSRTARTLTLAACLAAVCVAGAQAKILGAARAQAKEIAKRRTIGKRRSRAPSPRSSRTYDGPRTLGRPPRVRVSPYSYGSPYGYGYGYGGVAGLRVGGYPVYQSAPVVSNRIGTARIGLSAGTVSAPRAATVAGRTAPATYRAPIRSRGNDVSFSRVNAARQQFQRQYGFAD